MITQRMIYYCKLRISLIGWFFCSPIAWDWKANRVVLSKTLSFWNYILATWGFSWYSFFLFVYLLFKTIITKDIRDEADVGTDLEILGNEQKMLMILGWVTLLFVAFSSLLTYYTLLNREDMVRFFNAQIDADQDLQRKYGEGLMNLPMVKAHIRLSERLILPTVLISSAIPILYGFVIFSEIEPAHRMMVDVLEIELQLELKFIPVALAVSFAAYIYSNTLTFFMLYVLLYLHSSTVWLNLVTPGDARGRQNGPLLNNLVDKVSTSIGNMSACVYFQTYSVIQITTNHMNQMLRNVLVAMHHLAARIVLVTTVYGLITTDKVATLVKFPVLSVLCILGLGGSIAILFWETALFVELQDRSAKFCRVFNIQARSKGEVKRVLRGTRQLLVESGYPFFHIDQTTFMDFIDDSLHHVVDLLCL